jgi:HEAT repeat protein
VSRPERVENVRARLAAADVETRRLAVAEIPGLLASEACELLLLALADVDWRVRKEAATTAVRIEPRTAVTFALARALGTRDDIGLRNAAVEALVGMGPDAVPFALDALIRLDAEGRKLAIEVLAGVPTLEGMRALKACLGDENANVAVAAADGLGRAALAGEEARELAVRGLCACLNPDDASVQIPARTHLRLAALGSLRSLQASLEWPLLEPLMQDPLLRKAALGVAGITTDTRALRVLAEACADPSASLANEAVLALGRWAFEVEAVRTSDNECVDVLGTILRANPDACLRASTLATDDSEDVELRRAALLILGLAGDPRDVSTVADALGDERLACHAEAALRMFGADAMEPLVVASRTAAPSLRGATLSMLPQLSSHKNETLDALREAVLEACPDVVAAALKSVGLVGGASELSLVVARVRDPVAKVAGAAQAALLSLAGRHPAAARAMTLGIDPLGDDALVATLVFDALAAESSLLASEASFLEVAVTHRDGLVRRAALEALASTGSPDAARAASRSLADEEPAVANAAIRALGRLGRGEELASLAATTRDSARLGAILRALNEADPIRAFAAARPLLREGEAAVAAVAVDVVGALDTDARFDALMAAVDHPDPHVGKLALTQLSKRGDERAVIALSRALEHDVLAIRMVAAELLGSMGGSETEAILRARLERETRAQVREVIMGALSVRHDGGSSS